MENKVKRYEICNKDEPYAVLRYCKGLSSETLYSFNYHSLQYDRIVSKDSLDYITSYKSIHNKPDIPSIHNIQVSTRSIKQFEIFNCYIYACTQGEAIRIIKHLFKNIANMAFNGTYSLKEFKIKFTFKGEEKETSMLAKDKKQALMNFRKHNNNLAYSKHISNIHIEENV